MGKRISYDPYDHFILRAPLLPVGFLAGIPQSPGKLLPWLKELWNDKLIREAIVLGSYEFSLIIDKEFKRNPSDLPDTGIALAFLRYLCRFSSRCTPFGTFAGFTTGNLGSETAIVLCERTGHHLHARPDMEYLMSIARLLESDPAIREKLVYTPNTTLYPVGLRWHYIEVVTTEGKPGKIYNIVTIEDMGLIGGVLKFCSEGRRRGEIMKYLIEGGIDPGDAEPFILSLIVSQVIVTDLEPVICGPEYMDCLFSKLRMEFQDHETLLSLAKLKDLFDHMNKPTSVLANLHLIDPILAATPLFVNRNHLIQVDMKLNSSSMTIDSQVAGQILLGLRIRKALTSGVVPDVMKKFREAFAKRYGTRKVRLVKVLDPETGIGLEGSGEGYWTDPVPWIDDLRWGPSSVPGNAEGNHGSSWLTDRYFVAMQSGQQYITLESSDLQNIGIHAGSWPTQMTAMVEMFKSGSPGKLDIHFLSGSSGNPSYLLGRFGFTDPDLTQTWIRELIRDDCAAHPEAIGAEVVHLPEDRTGNILQRPAFLDFEIPYLARSAKIRDWQIPVTDLMISLENQHLVLSSEATGKEIRPYMTNAYNHESGHLAVYKFLHRIHLQDSNRSYEPDWGDAARRGPFIPGIRYLNMIIAPPVWLICCQDIAKWIHYEQGVLDLAELTAWKNERRMPDEMIWISADLELYFSWTNPNLIMALWDSIRNFPFVRVRPFYLSAGTPVKSPDGTHANQLVFCFRKS